MDKKKDIAILKKWFASQMIKRAFKVKTIVSKTLPNGIIVNEEVEKLVRTFVPPSIKDGIQRVWYLETPDKKCISYTEVKARVWNHHTNSYEVNNYSTKVKEITQILLKRAYESYGINYEEVLNENL